MKTAAIIALAGMAAVASAQTVHVALTHDDVDSTVNVGETVTWTMTMTWAGFTPDLFFPDTYAGGANMTVNGDNSLGNSSAMTYTPTNAGNIDGSSNGAGITHVSFSASALFGVDLPFGGTHVIGTFSFTAGSAGALTYAYATGPALSDFVTIGTGSLSSVAMNLGDFTGRTDLSGNPVADKPYTPGLTVGSDTLNIIPSPASAALLGLGGLVAVRRRR